MLWVSLSTWDHQFGDSKVDLVDIPLDRPSRCFVHMPNRSRVRKIGAQRSGDRQFVRIRVEWIKR